MDRIKNSLYFLIPLLAVFFFSISCAAQESQPKPQPQPSFGDTIVVGSIGDARNLIPILASDSASADICGMIFNGLVKYDKDLNLVGDLAESWEIQEGGLVIVFHLRKNVRWQDGALFTAKDVEFTYKKLVDPNVKTPYSGDFEVIRSVEAIDDYTVKVTYKQPFSPGLSSWGMWIMPKHLLENQDFSNTKFSRNPIGTGPYIFKKWKTAEKIEVVSNLDYFEGRPYIDRYVYRVIPDQATIFLELQTQGVDMTGLTPLQYTRQTDTQFFRKAFNKFRYPSFAYTYLGYNLKSPLFSDKKVRQALNYAINKKEIIEGVQMGLGRELTGPYPPESWAYDHTILPVAFDPEKAKAMLKEAGWVDTNGDGWLDKDGQTFEFTIITNQGNDQRKQCAEIIQRRLKDIGISVKIKVIEWSAFLSEFIDKRKFDAVILGWALARDPDPYDIWHSSKMREGDFNFLSFKNEEADKLMEQARREFDQAKRAEIYHKLQAILYDEQPNCFLYVPDALPIVNSRFKGIEAAPAGIGYNFIKWYVPRDEQRYIRFIR